MSAYEIVIPEPVARRFEEVVPHGIDERVLDALEELAEDPSRGVRFRGKDAGEGAPRGPMVYRFKVDRAPLILNVIVSYSFEPGERRIILEDVALDTDEDEDEAG